MILEKLLNILKPKQKKKWSEFLYQSAKKNCQKYSKMLLNIETIQKHLSKSIREYILIPYICILEYLWVLLQFYITMDKIQFIMGLSSFVRNHIIPNHHCKLSPHPPHVPLKLSLHPCAILRVTYFASYSTPCSTHCC